MEFGEIERNTSNWSNFCILLRRAGLSASAGLSCFHSDMNSKANDKYLGGLSSSASVTVWSGTACSSSLAHWSAAEAAWPYHLRQIKRYLRRHPFQLHSSNRMSTAVSPFSVIYIAVLPPDTASCLSLETASGKHGAHHASRAVSACQSFIVYT